MAERKRCILFIISQYLSDYSLTATNDQLIKETNLPTNNYQICDNVDLDTMFLDYCSYYQLRFGKQPKFIKKNPETVAIIKPTAANNNNNIKRKQELSLPNDMISNNSLEITGKDAILDKNLTSTIKIQSANIMSQMSKKNDNDSNIVDSILCRPPLRMYENYSAEWKEIADIICRFFCCFCYLFSFV